MSKTDKSELPRTLGATSLALNAINLTVGGGIFVVPAIVAGGLGPASFVAYLLCAMLMILVMLCYAEIGSKVTTSGGAYAYVEYAFGKYAGFLINILFWFGYSVVSDAAIANAMADMIGTMWPAVNDKIIRIFLFVLLFGFFAIINIRGAKSGARLVAINTVAKLFPLIVLIVFGLFNLKGENLKISNWPELTNYGEMALILFFAFGGTDAALGNSGEIRNPKKNIPRGVFLGLGGILVIYLLIQTVAQGLLGNDLYLHTDAPLASTAEVLFGKTGYQLVLFGAIISIYGTLSGDVLATSRFIYAGSKDKVYPEIFSKLHPRFKTPVYSIALFAFLITLLASIGEFKSLALIASSATLVVYLAVILATIKVRFTEKSIVSDSFKIPGGYLIPILAAVVVIWFLSHVALNEIVAMTIFVLIVSIFYFTYSKRNIIR